METEQIILVALTKAFNWRSSKVKVSEQPFEDLSERLSFFLIFFTSANISHVIKCVYLVGVSTKIFQFVILYFERTAS